MDNDVVVFAQLMVVLVPTVAAFVGIGLGARVLWRRGSRDRDRVSAGDDRRLERLETAVDAIAIEVERISEAQRFSAALLAERLPPRVADIKSPTSVKRINTPH